MVWAYFIFQSNGRNMRKSPKTKSTSKKAFEAEHFKLFLFHLMWVSVSQKYTFNLVLLDIA